MGFVRFLIALVGGFLACAIIILIVSLAMPESEGIGATFALLLPITFFFVVIGGVLAELMLKLIRFKNWKSGLVASAVLGIIYGCLILVFVTKTLGNPIEIIGWIWVVSMMVIALLVFYTIRTKMSVKVNNNGIKPSNQ